MPRCIRLPNRMSCPHTFICMSRTRDRWTSCGNGLSQEIRRVDPRMPVLSVATLAQRRHDDSSVWLARFGARLGLAAGAAALFLAALGIYAIKGYMVASRTSEIGIRKALGATQGNIMGMVLREGLVLTMVGLTSRAAAGIGCGQGLGQPALRRQPGRSGQHRRDRDPARGRLAAGQLHPGPPGGEGRSDGGAEMRIGLE